MKNKSKLEKMQMVRQFEQTGLIPKGTLKNFLSGKLSLLRLKGLVIAALAKSGRIPQFCAHVTKSQKQAPSRALYSQGTKQFTLNAEQVRFYFIRNYNCKAILFIKSFINFAIYPLIMVELCLGKKVDDKVIEIIFSLTLG